MLRKPSSYNKAICLRREGLSYNKILKYVSAAKSTIARWCYGIPLTEEQKERLAEKRRNNPHICALREQAVQGKKEAKSWAEEQVKKLSDRRQLLLSSGILLYWAEGARFNNRDRVEFTNTDPKMIAFMMKFFREILRVPEDRFRVMIRLREKRNLENAERYWAKITELKKSNLLPPEILENGKRENRYPYGMCRVCVYDVRISRKMMSLIKEFTRKFCPRSSTG